MLENGKLMSTILGTLMVAMVIGYFTLFRNVASLSDVREVEKHARDLQEQIHQIQRERNRNQVILEQVPSLKGEVETIEQKLVILEILRSELSGLRVDIHQAQATIRELVRLNMGIPPPQAP